MKGGIRTGILGVSESGKSLLAKRIFIPAYARAGKNTLVYDPLRYKDWGASFVMSPKKGENPKEKILEFCQVVDANEDCAVFIDECGLCVGENPPPEVEALATTMRHNGHDVFFLAQRGKDQIKTTMRYQFSSIFLFCSEDEDANEWAKKFKDERLKEAATLRPLHFIEKRNKFEPAIFRELVI